jgi:hypothetical protein
MTESTTIPKSKGLRARVGHVHRAFAEARQAPFLSGGIALLIFSSAFVLEELLALGYDAVKPDALKSEAELLGEDLRAKSERIESRMDDVLTLIGDVEGSDGERTEALRRELSALKDDIAGIAPELMQAVVLTDRTVRASREAKARDLAASGFSLEVDATLGANDGMTVCSEAFNLGVARSINLDRPNVRLTSASGEIRMERTMTPGQQLRISDEHGVVAVTYARFEEVGGEGFYGFNFACAPAE